MKQTAVEWLQYELASRGSNSTIQHSKLFEQAKELEKQQQGYSEEDMKKCWQEATEDMRKQFSTSYSGISFEKWLETFKNK